MAKQLQEWKEGPLDEASFSALLNSVKAKITSFTARIEQRKQKKVKVPKMVEPDKKKLFG